MSDITAAVVELSHQFRPQTDLAGSKRFKAQEVTTVEGHFVKQACAVHFQMMETQRTLSTLSELTRQSSLFNNQSSRIQQLSQQVEDSVRALSVQVNEIGSVEAGNACAEHIKDILQQKLIQLSREFKKHLERRSRMMKENESKRSSLTASSDVTISVCSKPTFMDDA